MTILLKKIKVTLPTIILLVFIVLLDFSPYILIVFTAAFIHELGHLIVMALCGIKVERITIYPFGLDIRTATSAKSYHHEIFIKSAGILANVTVTLFCISFADNIYISFFVCSNLLLAAVNLMPINSLDGGDILENFMLMYMNPITVGKVMRTISFIFIVILWIIAMYLLFYTNYNFSLFVMCVYLFTSIFLVREE